MLSFHQAATRLVVINLGVATCYVQVISDLLGQLVTKFDEVVKLVTRCFVKLGTSSANASWYRLDGQTCCNLRVFTCVGEWSLDKDFWWWIKQPLQPVLTTLEFDHYWDNHHSGHQTPETTAVFPMKDFTNLDDQLSQTYIFFFYLVIWLTSGALGRRIRLSSAEIWCWRAMYINLYCA